jgi:hypothetical protein
MGCVVSTTPRPIYPRERSGTHFVGSWVGPRTGLDRCEIFHPHRDSIHGPSSRYSVTIQNEINRRTTVNNRYRSLYKRSPTAYRGSRDIALLILNLGSRRGWVVSTTPGRFTPEKDPVLIVQEAGWAPGPVWMCAKNLAPTGIRSPDRPARNQSTVTITK